ncbi:MAG: NADP-dependent oxidoreductase [Solirubrobacteraceae bacterium]
MSRAVRYDEYGGIDVLQVVDVQDPTPGSGELLIRVKAAGINPGEAKIREGMLAEQWPSTFPSGQGSDLAGVVEQVGDGVNGAFAVGDEVIGWTDNRASQAELAVIEAEHATPKPAGLDWDVAGSLFVVGATAWAAVNAVDPSPDEVVVVSGAAGGVGSVAVQLARRTGATVVGLASEPNHAWLRDHDVIPVSYGDGVAGRIREAAGGDADAFIDLVGGGYVELALQELGVSGERIDTVADFAAIGKFGVKGDGNAAGARAEVLAELAGLIDAGELDLPIARVYPLDQVREAYRELEQGHTHGKIVLEP